MTEFKKVEALLVVMKKSLLQLHDALRGEESALDAQGWELLHHEVLNTSTDLIRRSVKLAGKALEQDPNKQIYNEKMCGRIIELRDEVRVCLRQGLELQDDAALWLGDHADNADEAHTIVAHCRPLEACYERYEASTLRQAQSKAWQDATAQSVAELLDRERITRVVLTTEIRNEAAALIAAADDNRRVVRGVEEARAAALWQAEVSRREVERAARIPASLHEVFLESCVDLTSTHWKQLIGRLSALLREVLANPERQGVRILRYTTTTIAHFGHPCVGVAPGDGSGRAPADVATCRCECHRMNAASEAVLRMVGYEARYNSHPQHNAVVQSWFSCVASDAFRCALPCGGSPTEHSYYTLGGFEPYGERSLVLREPNPQEEFDGWCAWHERLTKFVSELDRLIQR